MKSQSYISLAAAIVVAAALVASALVFSFGNASKASALVDNNNFLSFNLASTTAVSVGTGSTLVLASSTNPMQRAYVLFSNDSATNPIYMSFGLPAAASTGIRIAPGATYTINTNNLWTGAVYAQAASASTITIEAFQN